MSDELSAQERAKVMGISVGGALAGGGVGALASIPLNKRFLKATEENAFQEFKDKQVSKEHWENMVKIYKGEISLSQFPEEKQEFYKKMIEENKADVHQLARDRRELDELRRQHDAGKVVRFPGEKPKKSIFDGLRKVNVEAMKNVHPIKGGKNGVLKGVLPAPHFTVNHPATSKLPGIGGIVGLVMANALANEHYKDEGKNNSNDLKNMLMY